MTIVSSFTYNSCIWVVAYTTGIPGHLVPVPLYLPSTCLFFVHRFTHWLHKFHKKSFKLCYILILQRTWLQLDGQSGNKVAAYTRGKKQSHRTTAKFYRHPLVSGFSTTLPSEIAAVCFSHQVSASEAYSTVYISMYDQTYSLVVSKRQLTLIWKEDQTRSATLTLDSFPTYPCTTKPGLPPLLQIAFLHTHVSPNQVCHPYSRQLSYMPMYNQTRSATLTLDSFPTCPCITKLGLPPLLQIAFLHTHVSFTKLGLPPLLQIAFLHAHVQPNQVCHPYSRQLSYMPMYHSPNCVCNPYSNFPTYS